MEGGGNFVNTFDKIHELFKSLRIELEKLSSALGNSNLLAGKPVELASDFGSSPAFIGQFPRLTGTYEGIPVTIDFSIISDSSQRYTGLLNKPTSTLHDYLSPWLHIFFRQTYPFHLLITPPQDDLMSKLTRKLGLTSRGFQVGEDDFDTRYFLDCRSGITEAKAFLSLPETREQIQRLSPFFLLRFEKKHVKFISSISVSEDYQVDRLLGYIHALSMLKS